VSGQRTVAIANDHAGPALKAELLELLREGGFNVLDFGTDTTDSVDYPDYAGKVADAVLGGTADAGILICGTGIGMSIAANRRKGIRAALCHDTFTAKATRQHNDANILVLGARVVGAGYAREIAQVFLGAEFSNEERHFNRIRKID